VAYGSLDEDWRIARISVDAVRWFGQGAAELIGTRFLDLSHPDDLDVLLLALARATTEPEASVPLRLRSATGAGPTVRAVITLDPDEGTFDFALLPGREWGADSQARTEKLAEHLRHIAVEVQAADVMGTEEETISLGMPASAALSGRQWDIVNRLVRGERVTNMAAEMFLSPSTVRNHLGAIFRKTGVHSQQELLALLRGHGGNSPSDS
jgi:DNA-binding NarL/FixJ family response regulator